MKHRGHYLGQYGVPYAVPFIGQVDVIEGILRVSGRIDGASSGTAKALALVIAMKKANLPFAEACVIYEADLDEAMKTLREDLEHIVSASTRFPPDDLDLDDERMWYGRD
jgi:hypothetical protein